MAFFEARAGDTTYTLERMTLGAWEELKRDFGVDITELDFADPSTMIGMLFLAARDAQPDASRDELLAEVRSIDIESFETGDGDEPDPTQPAGKRRGAAAAKRAGG